MPNRADNVPGLASALYAVDDAARHADALIRAILGEEEGIPTVARAAIVRAHHRVGQLAAMLGAEPSATEPQSASAVAREAAQRLAGLVPAPRITVHARGDRPQAEAARLAIGAAVGAALSNEARHGSQIGAAIELHDGERVLTVRRVGRLLPPVDAAWKPIAEPYGGMVPGFGLRLVAHRARRAGGHADWLVDEGAVAVALRLPQADAAAESAAEVLHTRVEAALQTLRAHGAAAPLAEVRPLLSPGASAAIGEVLRQLAQVEQACGSALI